MKTLRVSAAVVKILLGMLFLVSAVSKFITIDTFEMYVYSFGIFPLTVSFYVARLVIGLELVLGAALISHRYHRFTILTTLLFLLCFIVFLAYAHLVGRSDSCHCFGDLMPLDPIQSILKNAILILLLVFTFFYAPQQWAPRWWLVSIVYLLTAGGLTLYMVEARHLLHLLSLVMLLVTLAVGVLASTALYSKWYVALLLALTPVVTTFILTPPDNWLFTESDERFDKQLFQSNVPTIESASLKPLQLDEGRHIVAFFSPNCKYCRLAAGKLTTLVKRYDIDTSRIVYVFPVVADSSSYGRFYAESRSDHFAEAFIDKELFIRITRAAFPLVVLVDEGNIAASFAYRNINENTIKSFMSEQ
ncbi:MAG: hypothetical protein IJR26_00425 [Bacteroidales bacterium]|nr:hypothetical protein [Bacteroidales bacterium]